MLTVEWYRCMQYACSYHCRIMLVSENFIGMDGRIYLKKISLFSEDPQISSGTTLLTTLCRNLCTWKMTENESEAITSG